MPGKAFTFSTATKTTTLRFFSSRKESPNVFEAGVLEDIFITSDPRTNSQEQVQLAPQFAGSTFPLPLSVDNLSQVPAYLVPPDTQRVALSADSTVPAQVELQSPGGGIDLFGDLQSAQNGNTVSTATVREKGAGTVGQGYWFPYVQEIGPFGSQ